MAVLHPVVFRPAWGCGGVPNEEVVPQVVSLALAPDQTCPGRHHIDTESITCLPPGSCGWDWALGPLARKTERNTVSEHPRCAVESPPASLFYTWFLYLLPLLYACSFLTLLKLLHTLSALGTEGRRMPLQLVENRRAASTKILFFELLKLGDPKGTRIWALI